MGAVRIYKVSNDGYLQWGVRSNGCTNRWADECSFGEDHGGFCNTYSTFGHALRDLNDPPTELGAFAQK